MFISGQKANFTAFSGMSDIRHYQQHYSVEWNSGSKHLHFTKTALVTLSQHKLCFTAIVQKN
jgi:hypothetical protein